MAYSNILLNELPDTWNGHEINMDFRTGIKIAMAVEDPDLFDEERWYVITKLLFKADRPDKAGIVEAVKWLLTGWNHDHAGKKKEKRKLIDYDVDQFRIYADFLAIYGIDLQTADMHYWTFQGLLWSMPSRQSSFMQVLEIRTKKPRKGATKEEVAAINDAQAIYGLKQPEEPKGYTKEEETKIDAFDALMQRNKDVGRQDHN